MFTIQNCGKSKQICNPAVLKKIWEWPQKFQGPEKQTFLDCDVSLLPSKTKKVIIITFSVLIMEKKGLEWSQGLKKKQTYIVIFQAERTRNDWQMQNSHHDKQRQNKLWRQSTAIREAREFHIFSRH